MVWLKDFVEIMFSAGMFVNAMLFVPQVIKLWKTKTTKGISLITFLGFNIIQISIIAHAYIHNDWFLLFGAGLALIICLAIVVLILMYRKYE